MIFMGLLSRRGALRVGAASCVVAIGVALAAAPLARGQAPQGAPITEGQAFVMATHSFHRFIGPSGRRSADPLGALAEEAGYTGHEAIAIQMIGGSTPMQHWDEGGEDWTENRAKAALRAGGVDVLTMSPNQILPEPGIDLFADLLRETNPEARLIAQASWRPWDGNGRTPSVGGTGAPGFVNARRDEIDHATLQAWRDELDEPDGDMTKLRGQLAGINARAGWAMASVVPSGAAVYRLRQEALAGRVPGVTRQSELFRDPIGHAERPVIHLVTYQWFAAMYRRSPVGLTALVDADDPDSLAREALLQRLAWNSVVEEPMSGVVGEPEPLYPAALAAQ